MTLWKYGIRVLKYFVKGVTALRKEDELIMFRLDFKHSGTKTAYWLQHLHLALPEYTDSVKILSNTHTQTHTMLIKNVIFDTEWDWSAANNI